MHERTPVIKGDDGDEAVCNTSANPAFGAVMEARVARRDVLRGGVAAAVGAFFAGPLATAARAGRAPLLGFAPVAASAEDGVVVPKGYRAQVLLPWGEPITGAYPAFSPSNSAAEQAEQMGSHHDGMHFFALDGRSDDGLLVVNHESIEPRFLHARAAGQAIGSGAVPVIDGQRDADEVRKELHAHGVSVVHIRKGRDGRWAAVKDARNRRITGLTPMEIGGPVRGSDLVRTRYSPDGTRTRGTLNNCAHGVTPWNTYLAAEENWAGYFVNRDRRDGAPALPREHARYGVARKTSRFGWELAAGRADEFLRFDASTKGASPVEDYRNEPNTFGYMVEIDPFDPASVPVKRTALGRFAHEGVVFAAAVEGRPVVCYSGDDAPFEYIYKFVSAKPYAKATAGGHLLDDGTLYVARFDADGSGAWLPLVFGQSGLTPENGFASQADVLVNTRAAADAVGATKMDRPEWGAVDPHSGAVYFSLTNNAYRTEEQVDAANPRAKNEFGHIIRWTEDGNDPAARSFRWDLFLMGGPHHGSDGAFACPDGLWFDAAGRLWIQTDMSGSVQHGEDGIGFGNNQMLCADPGTGEIRRFLVGPVGQEITGVVTTPDGRTLFVNVQHPGATTSAEDFAAGKLSSRWPDGKADSVPRSATVVITREDGGVIGA